MILILVPLWNVRKSITLTKIRTIGILILSHCCLYLLSLTNGYADCYTDFFFHGHIISRRRFSPPIQKAGCSLMRILLGTYTSYTVAAIVNTVENSFTQFSAMCSQSTSFLSTKTVSTSTQRALFTE